LPISSGGALNKFETGFSEEDSFAFLAFKKEFRVELSNDGCAAVQLGLVEGEDSEGGR
jgi:hypothetical protein